MFVLYLSQKGEMLNNQMCALGLPRAALPADDDALEQRRGFIILQWSGGTSICLLVQTGQFQTGYLVFAE